jgi:hypothetical protein
LDNTLDYDGSRDAIPESDHLPSYPNIDLAGTDIPSILDPAEMAIIEAAMRHDPNLLPQGDPLESQARLTSILQKLEEHRKADNDAEQTQRQAKREKKMSHAVSVWRRLLLTGDSLT